MIFLILLFFINDDCKILANKYNANIIEISDFKTNQFEVYATLVDPNMVWKTSKKNKTDIAKASSIHEARAICAKFMNPGVELNQNKEVKKYLNYDLISTILIAFLIFFILIILFYFILINTIGK